MRGPGIHGVASKSGSQGARLQMLPRLPSAGQRAGGVLLLLFPRSCQPETTSERHFKWEGPVGRREDRIQGPRCSPLSPWATGTERGVRRRNSGPSTGKSLFVFHLSQNGSFFFFNMPSSFYSFCCLLIKMNYWWVFFLMNGNRVFHL